MDPASSPDWLGACRRAAAGIRDLLADRPTIAERVEETGTTGEGGDQTLIIDEAAEDVVIDPIDGSLNAKRGLPHHAVSIAVADGPTMADVGFGFVQDFGPHEEWVAWRDRG